MNRVRNHPTKGDAIGRVFQGWGGGSMASIRFGKKILVSI